MAKVAIYGSNDPGKAGHVAWIDFHGRAIGSCPQPLIGSGKGGGGKGDTFDRLAMARLIRQLKADYNLIAWGIEEQAPQGAGRGNPNVFFSQGLCYGLWLGELAMADVSVYEIASQKWRKLHGVPQPKYEREPQPTAESVGSGDMEAAMEAWKKADRARLARQRSEGLTVAVKKAQALHPDVDFRLGENCKVPSPDKAIAFLIAGAARMLHQGAHVTGGEGPSAGGASTKRKRRKAAKEEVPHGQAPGCP